ncbi:isoaspartyl peptidase/L-asparaginase [Sorangium cellulosum]|uniref:isoaspartyl peptidase/L-asparaginase n=1 Tax=Sorangium cellulosum TaxID=56 RepID=UPI000CF53285|nr:isoaspartyl peptidase/L-asparaginase [Sorangium cellulosum]
MKYVILTHGGVTSPQSYADGCARAAEDAAGLLDASGEALGAAIAATARLEDDPRFNAGTGSNLRLDGQTIEMDAAVMASDGRFGAVACVERVKNPVLVAAKLLETPHLLLAGAGATAFARRLGFADHDPATGEARERHARALDALGGGADGDHANDAARFHALTARRFWNFEAEPIECDTVGAVVRDTHGRFAAAASTGGSTYTLRGRVGDVPLMGAGIYAGPHGAVATTGLGEEIARRSLARTVYDWLADGVAPARAAQRGVAMFPDVIAVGVLVVGRTGQAIASNRNMPTAQIVG